MGSATRCRPPAAVVAAGDAVSAAARVAAGWTVVALAVPVAVTTSWVIGRVRPRHTP